MGDIESHMLLNVVLPNLVPAHVFADVFEGFRDKAGIRGDAPSHSLIASLSSFSTKRITASSSPASMSTSRLWAWRYCLTKLFMRIFASRSLVVMAAGSSSSPSSPKSIISPSGRSARVVGSKQSGEVRQLTALRGLLLAMVLEDIARVGNTAAVVLAEADGVGHLLDAGGLDLE